MWFTTEGIGNDAAFLFVDALPKFIEGTT